MPKKILFLEHNVDGTVGGSHICLLGICKYLDRSRWVPLACFYQDNSLVSQFKELGVRVRVLEPFRPWVIRPGRASASTWAMRLLQSAVNFSRMIAIRPWFWLRILRAERIDAVHLNNSCGGDADLVIAAKLLRIPVIAHQRGFPPRFGRVERMLARRMDCIVAVSEVIKNHLTELGVPEKLVTRVHDGIELSRLDQSRLPSTLVGELGLRRDELVVGMLGNIKYWKGQRVLVDAMPEVLATYPRTQFVFVGTVADQSYKSELDQRIWRLGISDRVIFAGYRVDAIDLIGVMDVVVHASVEAEPFGLVVLEAMGKGVPVVATDLGGPRETVIHGVTGLLFASGNSSSLAAAINTYLGDASLRSAAGSAGSDHVRRRFSAEENARSVERVYQQVGLI